MAPKYEVKIEDLGTGHRNYQVICELYHITSNRFLGAGVGSCSTMESKYRYRDASKKCPHCGREAIIKGKPEYGSGWLCYGKKGGCNSKFKDGDSSIEKQATGKVENVDIADTYNTVLKMAKKRAHVDAVLTATAASDIFTQDIEDPEPKQEAKVSEIQEAEVIQNDPPQVQTEEPTEAPQIRPAIPSPASPGVQFVQTFIGLIEDKVSSRGTHYWVITDSEGVSYKCFSSTVAAYATKCKEETKKVELKYVNGKYGLEIKFLYTAD
jgi:hypothetical protein